MKCYSFNYLALFILFLFSCQILKTLSTKANADKNSYIIKTQSFNESEAKRYAQFSKLAICAKKPLIKNCKECVTPSSDGYKMFFFYEFQKTKNISYKFFIHYNDLLKKVVISFGAPSVNNYSYLQRIYLRGLSIYKLYNIRIENEFKYIYFRKLRNILLEKVSKLLKSGRRDYKFVFTGYSLGASLAVLSSYDLSKTNLISRLKNDTTVFTYGGLRIGDANFVSLVNSTVTLWKIVKQNDFIVRIPNCYYSVTERVWKCYTGSMIRKYIYKTTFPLRAYYVRYIRPLISTTNVILMRKRNYSFIEKASNVVTKVEKKNNNKNNLSDKRNSQAFYKTPQIVPKLSNVKQLYSVNTYYKYIYYTQPIGTEIFYDSGMTTFKICRYIAGISSCERHIKLPATFTVDSHQYYYGINFEQC